MRSAVPPPPPSVRVTNDTLDRFLSSVGEVILSTSQLRTARESGRSAAPLDDDLDHMDRVVGELKRRALALRTTPLLRVMENLPRVAREVAERSGKRVEVELRGAELELDRSILDRLYDPLVHLVRNAVDHGIEMPQTRVAAGKGETGRLEVTAARDKDFICIEVADDGAGLDLDAIRARAVAAGWIQHELAEDWPAPELARMVFRSGLSTATEVSDISGRGVGMDAVRSAIESLGGDVDLRSTRGVGTATLLRVPIAAAVQRALLVVLGEQVVALPIAKIERVVEVPADSIERSGGESFALVSDEPVCVMDLAEKLGWSPCKTNAAAVPLLIAEVRGDRVGLRIDGLAGQQDIYVKPVPGLLAGLRSLAGLTVLGDGRPVFLIDLNQLR